MSHIANDELGLSFDLPARFTVAKRFEYDLEKGVITNKKDAFPAAWRAASCLIENWQCETVALGCDLEAMDTQQQQNVVMAAIVAVQEWVKERNIVEKKA